jgi:hypothetical protein
LKFIMLVEFPSTRNKGGFGTQCLWAHGWVLVLPWRRHFRGKREGGRAFIPVGACGPWRSGEETDQRSDAAPAADAQLAAEKENFREKLAPTLARSNKFERRAKENRMENERLAAEKLQNQDLARENDELIRLKNELTG